MRPERSSARAIVALSPLCSEKWFARRIELRPQQHRQRYAALPGRRTAAVSDESEAPHLLVVATSNTSDLRCNA